MSGKHHLRDKWWPPEAEAVASASAPQQAGPDEDEWTTGHEPMTEPQASYLDTLAEDVGVGHVVGGRAPLVMSEYTGRAGMDSIPPLGKWDEWARSAAFDIDALRAYARAVYAQTDAVIAGLSSADLERIVDPAAVGLGVQSIQSLLMTLGTHTVVHSGEISAVKGMQDRKGYAF